LIWIGYQKECGFTIEQDFFIFCDQLLKEVTIYPTETKKCVLDETLDLISIEDWKNQFEKEAIFIPTKIKKLPKSVSEFKKMCKKELPELYL